MINVVADKLLVMSESPETLSETGIVLSIAQKSCAGIHTVVNSGVTYLRDGDSVVCETPTLTWEEREYNGKVGIIDATKALLKRRGDEWIPLRDDILLQVKKEQEVSGSIIVSSTDDDLPLRALDVIAVGVDCVDVKVGDVVIVPWTRITPPFQISGYESYGVTSEQEVLAILEEE